MNRVPSVLVLLHENDAYPSRSLHRIWEIVPVWRDMGIDVRIAHGTQDPVAREPADLVVPHLNTTLTPPAYQRYLDAQPHVLNAGVYDISKRTLSSNLVAHDDDYQGAVVVKSDANYGGMPELALEHHARRRSLWGRVRRRLFGARRFEPPQPTSLATATALDPASYPVFGRKRDVPDGVWSNPHLVVEKFMPERQGDTYLTRHYFFLGDREYHQLRGAPFPIVKGPGQTLRVPTERNEEIEDLRRRMGWDYGKFDYVVHEGRAVLIDANRTPGRGRDRAASIESGRMLAPGILDVLKRVGVDVARVGAS